MPYSSGGRPTTALRPTLGMRLPSKDHTSVPSSLWMMRGARSFHLAGTLALEHVRGLHDMVVHAHEDEIFGLHRASPLLGDGAIIYLTPVSGTGRPGGPALRPDATPTRPGDWQGSPGPTLTGWHWCSATGG